MQIRLLLKKNLNPEEVLPKYGFKLGRWWKEQPMYEALDLDVVKDDDFCILSTDDDENGEIIGDVLPQWLIQYTNRYSDDHIMQFRISIVPTHSYHVEDYDMYNLLHALYQMIKDGVIEEEII